MVERACANSDEIVALVPAKISSLLLPVEIAFAMIILWYITGLASIGAMSIMLLNLAATQVGAAYTRQIAVLKGAASSAFHGALYRSTG